MILSLEKIKEITSGAARITVKDGYIKFCRFTKEQDEYYKHHDATCYVRVPATAGVKMRFITDGENLKIKFRTELASSRTFFSLDVLINGVYKESIDNFSGTPLIAEYPKQDFELGESEKTVALPVGKKEVSIYFPWSVALDVKEIDVAGATFLTAVKPEKTAVFFGDSITQGYDALRPYMRYTARVADALNVKEINKGIGGEGFAPDLADLKEGFLPDYIFVAYGTNDWSSTYFDSFKSRLEKFFFNLNKNYPESKIYAISPIWRIDYLKNTRDWDFCAAEENIRRVVSEYKNASVISGFNLVPPDRKYFSDEAYVHPNDNGFDEFAKNLIKEIKK